MQSSIISKMYRNEMTYLDSYKDNSYSCYANIRMDNGDPIYISVAQSGVIVKKSRLGILGPKLFTSSDVYHAAKTAEQLHCKIDDDIMPVNCTIQNVVLKSFVKACLSCTTTAELCILLNETM